MQIRELNPDDAAEIGRLYAQSAAYLRSLGDDTDFQFNAEVFLRDGFGENPAFWGIVAEEAGQLWGYCLYNFSYDTDRTLRILYVLDLLVDKAARGKGIGMALMQAAEAIAREKTAPNFNGRSTHPINPPSIFITNSAANSLKAFSTCEKLFKIL